MQCLEPRRLRGDLIDTYKYRYKVSKPTFQLSSNRDTRGHSLKLAKDRCRLSVRSNFFSQRVINSWNSLPRRSSQHLQWTASRAGSTVFTRTAQRSTTPLATIRLGCANTAALCQATHVQC
jgi:hypothetical protein